MRDLLQELNSDPPLTIFEQLDANNLGKVITITAITGRVIGQRDQHAHPFW